MTGLDRAETLERDALAQEAQAAWERQRAHVTDNSAFYADLWDGRAAPADLRDLPELPLSDKAQLRAAQAEHPPFGNYLATDRAAVTRLHRTSGTTGQAMNLALSARDCRITEAVGGRSHRAAGLTPAHTVVHCLNYRMWMGGLTDHMTLEATGALVVPFGVGETETLIRTIREVGIDAISCTPSYPAVLKRVLEEKFPDLKPADLGLKLGLFGGEPGLDDPALRTRLRDTWGLEPRNANYGVSDVFSNFAAQCVLDARLHFLAGDVLHPELVDPEGDAPHPIAPGARGELVLTHLDRECQPLVRFRTGDVIAVEDTEPCRCGRTGFRFRVVGRCDDMVVVRGLNLFPTMVGAVLAAQAELSGDYRIILDAPPPHDVLPVTAELARGAQGGPALVERIEAALKRELGATARVTLAPHGAFPVTEGKTKRVRREYE
ncbi:phenylacetate--CoA ligase family protein [Roseovarius spongiae]|uniref:Phenylacetate--CoA ligase family protein n=1 Tax=Roseovarius spongiae TaxID=2320272 RepID=A0A3A8AWC4_9RHOB|nr:phenylacetate--CoA ligase family protein [Roseovarius spongiae]RKF15407.1 phenylacetate--CoA ligase family protein [Roseovarius spongiae]